MITSTAMPPTLTIPALRMARDHSNRNPILPYSPHMHSLANLAAVLVRPRATMRRILEAPRDRMVLPLFALAVLSGLFGDVDAPKASQMIGQAGGWRMALLVAGVALCILAVLVALAWFFAWVPLFIGRFLGGTGDIRGVRSALAWGCAPVVWALLYRLPAAIWYTHSGAAVRVRGRSVAFDPGWVGDGCGKALIFGLLELAVFIWSTVVLSNTVAEAHQFTAWHGLGTLVIAAIAPLVIALAALLAFA